MNDPTPAMPYELGRDVSFPTFGKALEYALSIGSAWYRLRIRREYDVGGWIDPWIVQPGSPVSWRDMRSPHRYTYPERRAVDPLPWDEPTEPCS